MGVLHKDLKPANVLIRTDGSRPPGDRADAISAAGARSISAVSRRLASRASMRPPDPRSRAVPRSIARPSCSRAAHRRCRPISMRWACCCFSSSPAISARRWRRGGKQLVDDKLLQSDIAAAAAGDPARRLGDAAEFARRLRHLDQRRAEARREAAAQEELALARTALDRARARRAPIMALIAALAVGLSASTWMYLRAERAQTRAEASAAQERAVTSFLTDDLLSSANPLLAGNPDIKVKDVLGTASAKLDRNFPNGGLDRAAIEAALGQVYAGLADPKHAEALLKAALHRRRPRSATPRRKPRQFASRWPTSTSARSTMPACCASVATSWRQVRRMRLRYCTAAMPWCSPNATTRRARAASKSLRDIFADTRKALGPRDPFTLRVQTMLAFHLEQQRRRRRSRAVGARSGGAVGADLRRQPSARAGAALPAGRNPDPGQMRSPKRSRSCRTSGACC